MNPEIRMRPLKMPPKRIIIVSLVSFILLMLAVTAQITYAVAKHDKVYAGVFIDDLDVGNLTLDELKSLLKNNYEDKLKDQQIALKCRNVFDKFTFSDINVTYNIQEAATNAYNVGRSGNIFERMYEIYKSGKNGIKFNLNYSFDRQKVEDIVQNLYNRTFSNVKEADLLIQNNKVTIRSGHHGENIDRASAVSKIENLIKERGSAVIEIPVIITPPSKINVDDFYNQIIRDAKDASTKVENNVVAVVPEVTGRSMDKALLTSIISELEKNEDSEKVLPVTFTKPKLLSDDVSRQLFKDTLGAMDTQFYTYTVNDANRGENIKLAVSKINGKVLGPGEVFSFNGVVGPRTVDGGYKVAHVYSEGKIVDDIGGGICQVSTTLYNSVLYSDLDVIERTNHMFTVGYVPLGRDAAVSYGDVDFKFKNSTNWPIKLEGWVTSDNRLFFSIKGTNENPGKTVEISSTPTKTLNFSTKYIDDPALPQGEASIVSDGIVGYIVDTYKIVKKDGNVVSETKLHTSVYNPLEKVVRRGTKKS